MIIFDEDRPSDSPFVERIWRCHSERGGSFLSIAESRCELVVTRHQGKTTLTVRGPETKSTPLGDCPAEGEWFGIRLKPGAHLAQLPARTLIAAIGRFTLATSHSSSISAFVSCFENKRVSSLVMCKEYLGHRERRGRT